MDAIFAELSIFEAKRADYLSDDEFKTFQQMLLINPFCGDVIQHTGGLRKVRFADHRRGKGKRGGLRVIYYWWLEKSHFLLFVIYDKDKKDDLSRNEREMLRKMLEILKQGGTL